MLLSYELHDFSMKMEVLLKTFYIITIIFNRIMMANFYVSNLHSLFLDVYYDYNEQCNRRIIKGAKP